METPQKPVPKQVPQPEPSEPAPVTTPKPRVELPQPDPTPADAPDEGGEILPGRPPR